MHEHSGSVELSPGSADCLGSHFWLPGHPDRYGVAHGEQHQGLRPAGFSSLKRPANVSSIAMKPRCSLLTPLSVPADRIGRFAASRRGR